MHACKVRLLTTVIRTSLSVIIMMSRHIIYESLSTLIVFDVEFSIEKKFRNTSVDFCHALSVKSILTRRHL